MTTDLRAEIIKAMAQANMIAEYGVLTLDDDPEWYAEAVSPGGFAYVKAEAALDAALDVLGERVTEWDAAAADEATLVQLRPSPADYLAVLRAGKGSE